jgi:hypothetical protein
VTVDPSKTIAALMAAGKKTQEELSKAVNATGLEIRGGIIKRYNRGTKSGVVYYRIPGEKYMTIRAGSEDGPIVAAFLGAGSANLSLTHQASAPGESPASDTGTLASQVLFKIGKTGLDGSVEMGDGTSPTGESVTTYGALLEYGTRKILPRPAWGPERDEAEPKFRKRLEDALIKGLGL